MPVSVSLAELVSVHNSRDLWPAEFSALVAKCEADPADRIAFGVVADWVDECGEPEYAAAWRWLMKRPEVEIRHYRPGTWESEWQAVGMPTALAGRLSYGDVKTLAGKVAHMGRCMADLRKELE